MRQARHPLVSAIGEALLDNEVLPSGVTLLGQTREQTSSQPTRDIPAAFLGVRR